MKFNSQHRVSGISPTLVWNLEHLVLDVSTLSCLLIYVGRNSGGSPISASAKNNILNNFTFELRIIMSKTVVKPPKIPNSIFIRVTIPKQGYTKTRAHITPPNGVLQFIFFTDIPLPNVTKTRFKVEAVFSRYV